MSKKPKKCSIPSCGQMARGSSGMCPRCQSWWRYHRYQSAGQFSAYLNRVSLASNRIARWGAL